MFHTPLCRKNCKVRHHEVITTLQAVAPKFSSSAAIFGAGPLRVTRGNNKEDFKKQVQKLVSSGWSKNEDVPERSEELRLPLLHLASMFGKHEIVEWLLNEEGYDANVRTTNSDETALHLVARHLYLALSAGESRLENMSITAKMANFERIVSLLIEKEVGLFWAKGSVSRETVFHILASNLLQAISADVNEEPETEDSSLSFYSQSIDVILKLLLAEEQTRLQRRDVKHSLSIKNSAGDTVLHLLAGASHKGYLVLKFLVKFLGNNDLLKLKNAAGLTALDIVNKLYPGHERELLVDEEAKKKTKFYTSGTQTTGRKQMELLQVIQSSNTNAAVSPGEPRNIVASSLAGLTNVAVGCVIHTPSFPGLCSSDCSDIVKAVGTLVDTHTPLCPTSCDLRHHLLTCAVFNPAITFRSRNDFVPITFKLCVQACFTAGWKRDQDVPEPLQSLQYPLLHLICMSGNCVAVSKLVEEMKFSYSVSQRSKETPLHVAARYFPITYPEGKMCNLKKIDRFLRIVDLIAERDGDMLFMVDANGDTVLHVLARCFCAASNVVAQGCGSTSSDRSSLLKQKQHYFKAIERFIETLADLVKRDRVCKKAVCKVLNGRSNADETFWDILQSGADKVLPRLFNQAMEMLPFCFGKARSHLIDNQCEPNCPCGGSADIQGLSFQAQSFQREGESSLQEPVSSSESPLASVQSRTIDISESQPNAAQVISDDSPPLIPVVHTPASSERLQAHIQSIQTQGQATAVAGNPSWQTVPVANPAPHIPVFFIKQEPYDLPQNVYYENNQVVCPSQRQTAVIIHPTSAMTTLGPNPLPVQAVNRMAGQQGNPVLQNPVHPNPSPSPQSNRHGFQGAVPPVAGRERISTVVVQPRVAAGVQQRNSGGNQLGRQASPQSVQQCSRREATIEEMAIECLNNLEGTYSRNCLHTPLCDASCIIDHHHVILTMYSTNNLKVVRGRNAFTQLLEGTKYNFLHCLKKHLDEGMAKDIDMPDGLAKLRYPLVHLAAMFYRYVVIDILACLGFDVNVRSPRTGEFPLHSMLRHAFETGLKVFKTMTVSQSGFIDSTFSKVLDCLSSGFDVAKILTQQDHSGDTPLHIAARMIVERPVAATASSAIPELEIPDSTQECDTSNSQVHNPLPNSSSSCKLQAATKEHQRRAEFYTICMLVMCRKIHDSAKRNGNLVLDLVKPILLVKNNDGETFLQILCKEHRIAAACIAVFLSRFPLEVLNNSAKECIPNCCWSDCIPTVYPEKCKTTSDAHPTGRKSYPAVGFSENSKRKAESPKPSSEVSVVQVTPTISTTEPMKTNTKGSVVTPIPATPLQSKTSGTDMDVILEAVITPVVANPTHSSLRPNTKRKIIDALKEDYSERLELAVKGRRQVEEDVLKHRLKMHELNEGIAKKKEFMQMLEKELQELQKEFWHENQAVQALENSLEQFTKEEEEMQKHLVLLQEAEPEPSAKRNKECFEQDTRL